jgi:hypothetical protein
MGFLFSKPAGFDYSRLPNVPVDTLEVKNIPTGPLTRLQQRRLLRAVESARVKIEEEKSKPSKGKRRDALEKAYDRTYKQHEDLYRRTIPNKNFVHNALKKNHVVLEAAEEKKKAKNEAHSTVKSKYVSLISEMHELQHNPGKKTPEIQKKIDTIITNMTQLKSEKDKLLEEYYTAKEEYDKLKDEYDKKQDELNAAQLNQHTTPPAANASSPTNATPATNETSPTNATPARNTSTSNGGRRKTKRAKRGKART